jgi:hypothetical protein
MPKTTIKSHNDQLKNPDASEYLVLKTFSMVVASIITLYVMMKYTAVALMSEKRASKTRPTILNKYITR